MAMTFTLVSHLRERLSSLMREKEERIRKEEAEKERRALEVRSVTPRPRMYIPTDRFRRRKKPKREAPP